MILLIAVNITIAQTDISSSEEKIFDDIYQSSGGEYVITGCKLSVEGEISKKTFEIEVLNEGEYFLCAWVLNTTTIQKNGGLTLYLNNEDTPAGVISPSESGWQSSKLSGDAASHSLTLHLTPGVNEITFCTTIPEVPPVDFIRLATNEAEAEIPEDEYLNFQQIVEESTLPPDYVKTGEDTLDVSVLYRTLSNPLGDYVHSVEQSFAYTYYTQFYFYAGQPVTFETKRDDPYASDPVMLLFSNSDPLNIASWKNDDGGNGWQSKLTVTIPQSGYYYLLLWSYSYNSSGTTNLYLYDNLYASNVAITHYGLRCDNTSTEQLNYFTSLLTGDSRIWIEDQDGYPGKVTAFNDDYYGGGGDFSWSLASRVKKVLPSVRSVVVSAYSSYNPTGSCDLYAKCGNSTIMSSFPNLKADDAIRSAPTSGTYNCISWSGGITSYWEWPLSPGSSFYVAGNPLASFDNYYSNTPVNRYAGSSAWNYTRTGATSTNNQVDLWAYNGSYTHGSVKAKWSNIPARLPANAMPHGYDWESKPGSLMRTFHPRNALNGSSYGTVNRYYKKTDVVNKAGQEFITSEESIARGLSTLDKVQLTTTELEKVTNLKAQLSDDEVKEFGTKYSVWKETWSDPEISIHSDPRKYAESKEYSELVKYCIEKDKKIFPLILEKLDQGDIFVIELMEDLTYLGNETLMEKVHKENLENQYNEKGAFVIHTLTGNWLNYGKKILADFDEYKGFTPKTDDEDYGDNTTLPDNRIVIQSYPNPFNPTTQIRYGIPENSNVTIKIYDILGREIATLVNNELQTAGWHNTVWNGKDSMGKNVSSGIYFCSIVSATEIQTIKLMLVR